ncbi:MAG: [LysW]-aminoadipate kinase [Calditrichaeota bacterium]|nr:MAG: [LysW]-aminoadipate kinase [Calditrichota bacterium]MBL1205630.1 [LysW]-aminoadipate kinase [Calditrichota bacterium]NOG45458.1 [LysW]-aminoadipate kinase [Calditrichota bacterium]
MIIVKIGGGESINSWGIIQDLANLDEKFIIVHGANALRDKIVADLNQSKKVVTSVSGYSSVFSDESALDVMMMAYSGLKNKRLVELCQQNGINAVGLSGLDGKMVQGRRNKGIRIKENGKLKIVRDFSGKPKSINTHLLNLLLENDYVPVLCVPIIDENNFAINSENDDIINILQEAVSADKILQLIEAPGFLDNPNNPESLVEKITQSELQQREEQVEGRMKRKMLALKKLFESGANSVIISDGRIDNPVTHALNGGGTLIQ